MCDEALFARVREVLDEDVRPQIQAHGGDVDVVSVVDGSVEIEFRAACAACDLRPVTFAASVRSRLLRVEGVKRVLCGTVSYGDRKLDSIATFFAR